MKIGIISDTHDRQPAIKVALQYFKEQGVHLVIHCGDWKTVDTAIKFAQLAAELKLPVQGVLGNNDSDVSGFMAASQNSPGAFRLHETILALAADGRNIVVYHGHHKPTLQKLHATTSIDVLLLGHTHKPQISSQDGKLVINPGSTAFAIPRSQKFQPSVAILDTAPLQASIHYL